MRKYVKVFLRTGLIPGIFVAFFIYVQIENASVAVLCGAGVGFGLSFISLFANYFSDKKNLPLADKNSEVVFPVEEKLYFKASTEELSKYLAKAILSVSKSAIVDQGPNLIKSRVGISWKSFGEKMEIKLDNIDSDISVITISSEPLFKAATVDCGKNLENVSAASHYLKSQLTPYKMSDTNNESNYESV